MLAVQQSRLAVAGHVPRIQPLHVLASPGVNLPPRPIIVGNAAIVVGDMKLVVGKAIDQTIFTGPHYPNSSTPDTDVTEEVRPGECGGVYKVPTFDCSTPTKLGCLFNLSTDPTEHVDVCNRYARAATSTLFWTISQVVLFSTTRHDTIPGKGESFYFDPCLC